MAIKQQVLETRKGTRQTSGSHYDLTVEPLHNAAGAIVGITCAALNVIEQQCHLVKNLAEALLLSGLN